MVFRLRYWWNIRGVSMVLCNQSRSLSLEIRQGIIVTLQGQGCSLWLTDASVAASRVWIWSLQRLWRYTGHTIFLPGSVTFGYWLPGKIPHKLNQKIPFPGRDTGTCLPGMGAVYTMCKCEPSPPHKSTASHTKSAGIRLQDSITLFPLEC